MSRLPLSRQEFLLLHDTIVERYHKECADKGINKVNNKSKMYGYGKHEEHPKSIAAFMGDKPEIKAYLKTENEGIQENRTGYQKIIGKNLYNKFQDAKKEKNEEIILTEPYSIVYFLYIDCTDVEDFREKFGLKQQYQSYFGYYYSRSDNEVKSFQFQLAYAQGNCSAIVNNFHEGRRQDPFKGSGTIKSNNLFINTTNAEGIELKIILPTEGNQILLQPYLMGVLTTVTSENFPISVRIFLARIDSTNSSDSDAAPVSEDAILKIKRYLNLQRQVLRAPIERVQDLEALSVRDEQIENLVPMIGVYWMWRYINEDIVQIKMTIQDDFTVQVLDPLYTGTFGNQIGNLNSSRIFHHNLCISTFPRRGYSQQVISYYMIDIPQGKNWKYLKGNYSNVGNPAFKPSGGSVALYKQQDNFLDAEHQIIKKDELSNYLDHYPEFVQLKTMLDILSGKRVK